MSKELTHEDKQRYVNEIKAFIETAITSCQSEKEKQKIINTAKLAIEIIQESVNHNGSSYFNNQNDDEIDNNFLDLLLDLRIGDEDNGIKTRLEIICTPTTSILGNKKVSLWGTNYTTSAQEILNWLNSQPFTEEGKLKQILEKQHYSRKVKDKILECYKNKNTQLYLSNCSLKKIPSEIFEFFPFLIELHLSRNQISTIPANAFAGLNSLRELDLSQNPISTIPANAFAGLNSLRELDLSQNQISTIEANAFAGLNSLRELDLSQNQISTIEANAFAGLNSLQKLNLRQNQISTIEANAFAGLNSLQKLNLSRNQISTIPANAFAGLNSLQKLYLDRNEIRAIQANAFAGLNSLQELGLSRNQISTIEADAFAGLNSLKRVVYSGPKGVGINVFGKLFTDIRSDKNLDWGIRTGIDDYKHGRFIEYITVIDQEWLIQYYIHHTNPSISLCDQYCLNLLKNNELTEPEALSKIATRIADGHIRIADTELDIDYFIRLSTTNNIPLMKYLLADLPYFIKKHDIDYIKKVIENNILIEPLQHNQIEELAEKKLISQLKACNPNIEDRVIREQIIPGLRDGSAHTAIVNIIKQEIGKLGNTFSEEEAKNISKAAPDSSAETKDTNETALYNLVKINLARFKGIHGVTLDDLAKVIFETNHGTQAQKNKLWGSLKGILKTRLFNEANLDELTASLNENTQEIKERLDGLQEENINKFAKLLTALGIEQILDQYLQEKYLDLLGIDSSQSKAAYKVMSKYLKWNTVIDEYRANNINEITQQITAKDEQVREVSEVYYTYVLNTLPYRSYSNILAILKANNIPDAYRQKLELVVCYCQLKNVDEEDAETLNVFVVEDKTTKTNYLIHLKQLDYLNSKNITGFTLEQFTVNQFTDVHYQTLTAILNESTNLNDDAVIDCSGLDKVLFINLQQLKSNNQLNPDIDKFIAVLATTNKISKADLRAIVNDAMVKKYLKEVESQPLGLNHLSGISFPRYLHSLISDKFSAANIVAKHISLAIKDITSVNGVKITLEQSKKLEEVCYQVALNPGKDISLPLDFKKKLIHTFNDPQLLDGEKEREENGTKVIVKAGEFTSLALHLNQVLTEPTKMLELLPEKLVEKAETLQFTQNSNKIIQELFNELNLLPDLKGKITIEEIEYILGVIFIDMSSIHVLGYHVGDNVAFARFRLLGAYYLAKAICANNKWSLAEKTAISRQIKEAILTEECSGQITTRLYGEYCNNALKNIYNKAKQILQARMIL